MGVERVAAVVGDTPNMSVSEARRMTRFIAEQSARDVLELGFHHGVSTCYIAEQLRETGGGSITTIDLERERIRRAPNVEELLETLGLRDLVTVFYEPTSYNWRLMTMIEESSEPRFDFCYIDGAHTWDVDGLAFFLVDKLLRPGGWIVFDDLDWTLAASSIGGRASVEGLPAAEQTTRQVRKVFELLVRQHPSYGDFRADGNWGFARKQDLVFSGERRVVSEQVVIREHYGAGAFLERAARTAKRLLANSRP